MDQLDFTSQEFMLLALDDESGKFITNSYKYRCGLAASILLDLYQNNVIIVKRKKSFFFDYAAVSYNPDVENVHPLYESVVDDFKRHEPQKISYWVKRIVRKQHVAFETAIIENLIALGVLEKVSSRTWLFEKTTYPAIDLSYENDVRKRLKAVVNGADPSVADVNLLSILKHCRLSKALLLTTEEKKLYRKRLKEFSESDQFGKAVKEIFDAIAMAAMAMG